MIAYHGDDWAPDYLTEPDVRLLDGPVRIYDNDPEPDLPRRPVGFAAVLAARELEMPMMWEGDNA